MLQKLLFDTRVGGWLLSQLEARAGLAVVASDWLGNVESGSPAGADDTQPGLLAEASSTGAIVPSAAAFSKAFVER